MTCLLEERPAGVCIRAGCDALALPRASLYRYQARQQRKAGTASSTPSQASTRPAAQNRLRAQERAEVLNTLNSPRFADQPPAEVYATLLSEGTYLCSVSTLYRLLRAEKQSGDRRPQRPPQRHAASASDSAP